MTQDEDWMGEKRKINAQFIKDYVPDLNQNLYFITGTQRFVPSMFREISILGVSARQIKMEIFTGY